MKDSVYPHCPEALGEVLAMAGGLGFSLPVLQDVSLLARPVEVGGFVLPNGLAIHPMEGCDGTVDGRPGELTLRRYDRFAAGGAGLLWVEAIAVVPEGRANPRQLWITHENLGDFAAMVERMRRVAAERFGPSHRPMLVAQLTHSGRYSRPVEKAEPIITQNCPARDAAMNLPADYPLASDDYLAGLVDYYVEAARLAFAAGFDAVDVKACHGYLLNEILGGHERPRRYGGSFENRTRLMLDIVDAIAAELGSDKMVTSRLGVFDPVPWPNGWGVCADGSRAPDLTEPKQLVGLLSQRGVKMLNITLGNPYYQPSYNRPFDKPAIGGAASPEHPLCGVERMIRLTGELQQEFPRVAMVGTGYSWLRTLMPQIAAGVVQAGMARLVGVGRMAFAYPDFAADICERGVLDAQNVCVACSACTQIMRDGGQAGCVVRDAGVYGPIYKQGRQRAGAKANRR